VLWCCWLYIGPVESNDQILCSIIRLMTSAKFNITCLRWKYHGTYRLQRLESPEIKMLIYLGLEGHGKRHGSWKSPGILNYWSLKFYFLVQISLPVTELAGLTVLGSLEYINTTTGIAFRLVYSNAVTLKTDLVCALLTSCSHVCEWSVSWKVLEDPGIWSLQVLENSVKEL